MGRRRPLESSAILLAGPFVDAAIGLRRPWINFGQSNTFVALRCFVAL